MCAPKRWIRPAGTASETPPPAGAGRFRTTGEDLVRVLWTDGQPLLLVGASARASGVNAGGVVVAVGGEPDSRGPFVWRCNG
jgi:hypothetical protein